MRLSAFVFLAVASVLAADPASACSCRCTDAATLVRETPIFFRGTATGGRAAGAGRRYDFAVRVVHKGDVPAKVRVTTPSGSAACGVNFPLSQEVLVGANRDDAGGLHATLCTHFCIGQKRDELERILARCVSGKPCPPSD